MRCVRRNFTGSLAANPSTQLQAQGKSHDESQKMGIPEKMLFVPGWGGFGRHRDAAGCGAVSQGCHPGQDSVGTVTAQSVDAI